MQLMPLLKSLTHAEESMTPNPNVFANATEEELGLALLGAFHKKDAPTLQKLTLQGAPVGVRLDYVLSVRLEADFVAALKVILGGTRRQDAPLAKIQKAFDYATADATAIQEYTRDAFVIRDILKAAPKQDPIPVNPAFINYLQEHAVSFRDSLGNCSLMAATGMIDTPTVSVNTLISQLVQKGIVADFKGYFGCTASMWSVILLDIPRVAVFFNQGASIHATDTAQNSLLHWATATAAIDDSPEHRYRAEQMITWLLAQGADPASINRLGYQARDY